MDSRGTDALLPRIDVYFDRVPRASADVEEHGPLRLFTSRIPWRLYARPVPGGAPVDAAAVSSMRKRQRELGVPERFEWIDETAPGMAEAVEESGLIVTRVPLLALEGEVQLPAPATGVEIRLVPADDPDLPRVYAAIELSYAPAPHGPTERDETAATHGDLTFLRDRIARGLTVLAAAWDERGPLAGGSHQPAGEMSEVVGVGTLHVARRRGLGAAVTARLVADARERGASLVVLSAADDDVAGLYQRLGFRIVGTACFGRTAGDGP